MKTPGFWYRPPGLAAGLLAPAGWLFDTVGRLQRHLTRPHTAGIPVICVGNLVAGGAGKTPVSVALAQMLKERGHVVHFLSRGYPGHEKGPLRVEATRHEVSAVGDEALLLAATAPTWVARRRAAGAQAAEAAGAQVLVMDDGFQHPGLARSLGLVVVDGVSGFGNGRVIPAGPLREDVTRGLARADGVVVMGEDQSGVGALVATGAAAAGRHLPVFQARLVPDAAAVEKLRGKRVLAFAGIGQPEKFFRTCHDAGIHVLERAVFADHHRFRTDEIEGILQRARALHALPLTTAKDAVRLPAALRDQVQVLPVTVAWRNRAALERLLSAACARS